MAGRWEFTNNGMEWIEDHPAVDGMVWDPVAMQMIPQEQAALSPAVKNLIKNWSVEENARYEMLANGYAKDANDYSRALANISGVVYRPGSPNDPANGGLGTAKFGGYDSGGLFGALGKIGDVGMNLADNTVGKVAENTIGKVGDALDPVMDDIGDFIEPVVGNEDLWFAATAAALGGAAAGALNSGSTMGSGLATGATDAAGGAIMPGATSAAAGGTGALGAGAAGSGATDASSGVVFNNAATGGLNPAVQGGMGLSSTMPTGVGLNGASVGLPATTGGAAFNSALSPGLQSALGGAAGAGAASGLGGASATSPIFNNVPGATSTGGLNPAITGQPGLNPGAVTGGTGLNTAAGGQAFNNGLPGLSDVLAPAGTQVGAVQGATTGGGLGGLLNQITQAGQSASQVGNALNQLTNGESGGTPTNQQNGQYNLPWQFLLSSVLPSLLASRGNQQTWDQAWNDTLNADPWRAEQGKYMPLLLDTAQHGIGDTAYGHSIADSVARQNAAKGYNMSGNMLTDIAKSLDSGTNARIQALSPLAMGRAPDTRGLAQIASGRATAGDDQWATIGAGLSSILGNQGQTNNNNFSLGNFFNSLGNLSSIFQ